jgi:uncharacterized protein with HEPN domain
MKHPERVEDCLEHISQAIQRASEYVEGVGSVNAFRISQRDQDAVIRNIEIIGEAGRQIQQHMPEFVTTHPELPWREMGDIRNRMIHNYFNINFNFVWSTVKDDLPKLKQQIDQLLTHRQPGSKAAKLAALSQNSAATEQGIRSQSDKPGTDRERD